MAFNRMRGRPRSERWQREDAAERLVKVAPELRTLRLELHEATGADKIEGTTRTRHIAVPTAGAFFEVSCTGCKTGAFDLTQPVLSGLEEKQTRFDGECTCSGTIDELACDRVLHYTVDAQYA
jgi:hypothetical protein